MKLALREVAIIFGLTALAGPRFGMEYEQVVPRGSDLYVLIDVSRSMLADDVPPSRLGRAKADVLSLVNRLEGERIGLIAFAGQAVVKCPLTVDYDSFRRALEELDPDSAPRGGTAIGDAIRKAIEVFHAKSDRDQAVLLITDGDDQQSYPLEAAAIAAERHVTIFTLGLGDAERGARVPQKANTKTFLEYQGEQVWSKLDSDLLQQIALKTAGVYIPAGTRAYDLGELYTSHLQGRRSDDAATQQRIRRSERFQIFLAIALISLLVDLSITSFRRVSRLSPDEEDQSTNQASGRQGSVKPRTSLPVQVSMIVLALGSCVSEVCRATEPYTEVREGLKFYAKDQFDEAQEKFAAANEELDKQKSAAAAVAAFDEACAYHRKGDLEHARDCYLRAGLSQERSIATAAHFNLGTLAAEQARTLCGDHPENVPPDKRPPILEQLAQAIAAYRHCLELQSDHAPARRNLELVRQWIKYYTDRWHEQDRQKRRDESNLLVFLEFLMKTQTVLREAVNRLPEAVTTDNFAELKRAQEELREEIPTLREKIDKDLRPQPDPNAPSNQPVSKEVEEGITLLQGWADTAGQKMSAASRQIGVREPDKAVVEQQAAIEELEKIWDAVVPFHPLLAAELVEQTSIAKTLMPPSVDGENPIENSADPTEKLSIDDPRASKEENTDRSNTQNRVAESSSITIADDDLVKSEESQTRTLKRTRLLAPKAEAELNRLGNEPSSPIAADDDKPHDLDDASQSQQVDPEQIKAGYRKAIELAPQAVEQMEQTIKALQQKDRLTARQRAEDARRILEEIQQAQPKNNQQQDQQKQDQQQGDDQQQKANEQKSENKEQDGQKDQPQSKPDDRQSKEDQQEQDPKQQQQVSQDRVEDALRKVRERQQEKRERDRKFKGQFLGRAPVDKDW